jgi:hypothetical protein
MAVKLADAVHDVEARLSEFDRRENQLVELEDVLSASLLDVTSSGPGGSIPQSPKETSNTAVMTK